MDPKVIKELLNGPKQIHCQNKGTDKCDNCLNEYYCNPERKQLKRITDEFHNYCSICDKNVVYKTVLFECNICKTKICASCIGYSDDKYVICNKHEFLVKEIKDTINAYNKQIENLEDKIEELQLECDGKVTNMIEVFISL